MERRSPTSLFISVDLPTLGIPMIDTKPARCGCTDNVGAGAGSPSSQQLGEAANRLRAGNGATCCAYARETPAQQAAGTAKPGRSTSPASKSDSMRVPSWDENNRSQR
eukprot:scaffold21778_cov131-Isochrysis_galbana.AAC.16